jgi:hypothetical protein
MDLMKSQLTTLIDAIIKVYVEIRAHCETFKADFTTKDMVVPNALHAHAQAVKA